MASPASPHIQPFTLGDFMTNCFVVTVPEGEDPAACWIVDCGFEPEPMFRYIDEEGLKPAALLLTHAHADHCGGAAALRERLGLQVALSAREADALEAADEAAISLDRARDEGIYPADLRLQPCPVARRLDHGDQIQVGSLTVAAIEVPGHSAGSICYFLQGAERACLFTGDTVFLFGAISLLNCDGSSLTAYRRHIPRLAGLGVDALLPGHGGFCLGAGQAHIDQAIDAFKSIWPPANYR